VICPRCRISYDPNEWDACPQCEEEETEYSGVLKTSTILIFAGKENAGVYRSVEEVPEPLRKMLVKSTSGLNSGTIFIADQRGRERIAKAIRTFPAAPRSRWKAESSKELAPVVLRRSWVSLPPLVAAALVLAFAAGIGWLAGGRAW